MKESKSKTIALNKEIFKSAKTRDSTAPVSIWDKMQAHDTNLYEKEQELKRFKKRQNQLEMREFLSNQMMTLKRVETLRKNQEREHENELVANDIAKQKLRDQQRNEWLRE